MEKLAILAAVLLAVLLAGLPASAQAKVVTQAVDYKDGDTALQGWLAYDDTGTGKRPGVVVVPEWWGLTEFPKGMAERVAGLGYVALAIDMYGKGVVATDPQQAKTLAGPFRSDRQMMRRRATAGLEELRKHPQVDTSKLAAIGFCFGGTTVLELARAGAPLAGFVSFHGGLDTPSPAGQGAIKAPVLALHGAEDPNVPPAQVAAFMDEMRKAGADWQFVHFSGAVHAFTNPGAGNDPSKGIAYDEKAARRSWHYMETFLREVLEGKK